MSNAAFGQADFSAGAAYVDGAIVPLRDAKIPVTDWGYRRSDVTYDVVGVYFGAFFRLPDHIARFRASMTKLRMQPKETDAEIETILHDLVRLTGFREAYVAMDCLRARPGPGVPFHAAHARSYLVCFASRWVWRFTEEQQARGIHTMIAKTPRISSASVDPTVKNFHWGDFTRADFEAFDAGVDTGILLDADGFLTEGGGYNVFVVLDGTVVSSPHGALEGITRRSVYELCESLGIPCAVRPVSRDELGRVDEMFFSTTAGGIMPVGRIGDTILNNDRPGPISARLREAFWNRRRDGWHATPVDYDRS